MDFDSPRLAEFEDTSVNGACKISTLKQRFERWYILLLFGSLSFMNMFIWNAFGPIADVAQHIFGWTDANIAMLYNWGSITFLCVAFISASLVDRYGLRASMLASSLLVLSAAGCRCIYVPNYPRLNTVLQNISAILNGLPVVLSAPSVVSAVWFPASQRTMATSLIVLMGTLGYALAFVLGPAIVHNPFLKNHTADIGDRNVAVSSAEIAGPKEDARRRLFGLFYATFGITAFLSLCVLAHFPSQPRKAPSASAAEKREPFRIGLRQLAGSCSFWSLVLSYALVVGAAGSWISLIYIVLRPLGAHSELDAGFIGFLTNVIQAVMSVAFAQCADANIRHSKTIITTSLMLSAAFFTCFALMASGFLPFHLVMLNTCLVLATSIASGLVPVYIELTNEVCYPVNESLCAMSLCCGNQLASSLFYTVVSAVTSLANSSATPHEMHVSAYWLFWTPVVSITLSIVPLLCFRARFNRVKIDHRPRRDLADLTLVTEKDNMRLLAEEVDDYSYSPQNRSDWKDN